MTSTSTPTTTLTKRQGEKRLSLKRAIDQWAEENPLRRWRTEHGYNASSISPMLAASVNSIGNWERGKIRPGPAAMARIADAMQVSQLVLERRWTEWYEKRPSLAGLGAEGG